VKDVLATASDSVSDFSLLINLKPRDERGMSQKEFEASIRPVIAAIPDIQFTFTNDSGKEVSVALVGNDGEALIRAARALEAQMRTLPELAS
ncbi:efflux RND transporter permease subunit, partial [Ochrobactrum sp. MR34]|nr:efflux RND transporter permease subunit [Ochrobactrum sp. MR34]